MLRSRLKNKENKTKRDVVNWFYKKQRNYMVALNQKLKYNYFNNLDLSKGIKHFWKTCELCFSNKHIRGDTSIILTEKDELILSNVSGNVTSLVTNLDIIDNIVLKFHNHSSITKL